MIHIPLLSMIHIPLLSMIHSIMITFSFMVDATMTTTFLSIACLTITRHQFTFSFNTHTRLCIADILPIAINGNIERRSEGTIASSEPHLTTLLSATDTSSKPTRNPAGNRLLPHEIHKDLHVVDSRLVCGKESGTEVLVIHILHEAIALGATRDYSHKSTEQLLTSRTSRIDFTFL